MLLHELSSLHERLPCSLWTSQFFCESLIWNGCFVTWFVWIDVISSFHHLQYQLARCLMLKSLLSYRPHPHLHHHHFDTYHFLEIWIRFLPFGFEYVNLFGKSHYPSGPCCQNFGLQQQEKLTLAVLLGEGEHHLELHQRTVVIHYYSIHQNEHL